MVLGGVGGKKELSFVSIEEERGYLIYHLKAFQENLPAQNNIDDSNGKIMAIRQEGVLQRGERGRNKFD